MYPGPNNFFQTYNKWHAKNTGFLKISPYEVNTHFKELKRIDIPKAFDNQKKSSKRKASYSGGKGSLDDLINLAPPKEQDIVFSNNI